MRKDNAHTIQWHTLRVLLLTAGLATITLPPARAWETPEVEPTNNLPERLQRSPAQDRQAGRTSETAAGAHRRSVIVSVLVSLRVNLAELTLDNVLEEVRRWMQEGVSLFTRQWQEAKIAQNLASSPCLSPSIGPILPFFMRTTLSPSCRKPLHAAHILLIQWTGTLHHAAHLLS